MEIIGLWDSELQGKRRAILSVGLAWVAHDRTLFGATGRGLFRKSGTDRGGGKNLPLLFAVAQKMRGHR